MAAKLKYSTDRLNRLLVNKDNKNYPIDGEFSVEENNLVFKPSQKSIFTKDLDLPRKMRFEGNWHLTPNKDFKLVLIETDNQVKNDELKIKGQIISAQADAIVFQMHCIKEPDVDSIKLLRLGGRWQADEFNQLAFFVARDIAEDILRFNGSWQVNKNQEIIYTYEKQDLIRKTRTQEQITFKGYWQISSTDRLTYILDFKNRSFFEFKVQMGSPNLIGKTGEIRYRIGIGVKELARERVFLLFGTWKINRTKSISFEVNYGEDGVRAITFGASVFLNKNNEFVFELTDKVGKDLGFTVQFNKKFFKNNAIVFARLRRLEQDLRVEGGLKVRW
ncbi:MAG: hypothetical protein AMJ78_03965 [Omnitrophica WOR_2 bacterium SM23_29]|nr:MAG: hypothetical protein AMJ78_03965 [Omnitrophica WOR_2 bacterium SM23_29]